LAVMRSGSHYLLACNGIVGTGGFGNHKHNDLLSFEYHPAGVPLVVDPGSYVYTSDFGARNRFRGTASHNTVQVDGREQNELNPEWIFRLFETSNAEHVRFDETAECVEYVGRHHGFERFAPAVTHERAFRLVKKDGALEIVDVLTGDGVHSVRWHFHLAPGADAALIDAETIRLTSCGHAWRMTVPADLAVTIADAAYSPSYGVLVPCRAVDFTGSCSIAGSWSWAFSIRPESV